ncbi:DUF5677 domain-containing protein [Elusimicrobiota bacterium]
MNEEILLAILKDSLKLARTEFKDKLNMKTKNLTKLDIASMGLLAKSTKTVDAIICLTNKNEGFGEDALTLTRTLYENLVSIKYIYEQDSEKRAELYWGYGSLDRYNGLLKMKKQGINKEAVEKFLAEMNYEELSNIKKTRDSEKEKLRRKEGFKESSWSYLTIKQMSNEIKHISHYERTYKSLSQIVHAHPSSILAYMHFINNKVEFNDLPNNNSRADALDLSLEYYLVLLGVINERYSLGVSAELEKIVQIVYKTSAVTD